MSLQCRSYKRNNIERAVKTSNQKLKINRKKHNGISHFFFLYQYLFHQLDMYFFTFDQIWSCLECENKSLFSHINYFSWGKQTVLRYYIFHNYFKHMSLKCFHHVNKSVKWPPHPSLYREITGIKIITFLFLLLLQDTGCG